jgi:hypothetical protein
VAIGGTDGFDALGFLPRLFGDELAHLEALEDSPDGVTATAFVLARDAEAAKKYVEGRITASLRTRALTWITTIMDVSPVLV